MTDEARDMPRWPSRTPGRLAASAAFRRTEPRLERWLTGEATRLSGTDPVAWSAAQPLLEELGLDGT